MVRTLKSCDCGLVRLNFKAYIYFCRLHLGFNVHKCCVHLWRSSWWTKLFLVTELMFRNNPPKKSYWVVVEGTRVMQHSGLAYKNTSSLKHSITVKCRNYKERGRFSRLFTCSKWMVWRTCKVQTFISGNVRHDGVKTLHELCDCSVSLVHDRNAEKQHWCDTLPDTSEYKD